MIEKFEVRDDGDYYFNRYIGGSRHGQEALVRGIINEVSMESDDLNWYVGREISLSKDYTHTGQIENYHCLVEKKLTDAQATLLLVELIRK
ncbi:hypothetical protein [Comamonas sp.]|uniref:hypothetical protein n=1 Tax=Comamonas sp. TaxID=34028 RepID=UPI0028973F51|nr:hypothetical protein [Comamonas sp.]